VELQRFTREATEDPMTDDKMALVDLLQKSSDSDLLRAVAEAVLQILMEADAEGLVGAGRHERSADRLNYRNGYRERSLDTRFGSLQLRSPKLRQGSYFPPSSSRARLLRHARPRTGSRGRWQRSQASVALVYGRSSPLSTISSSAAVKTASSSSSTSQRSWSLRRRRSIS
jgi:hypothetical protein